MRLGWPTPKRAETISSLLIPAGSGKVQLEGDLHLPEGARGLILFAHGSGSSRHSPRNSYVAQVLNQGGLGSLLMDLLTHEEEALDVHTGHLRFDIALLAERLVHVTDWLGHNAETRHLPLAYFGASTGGGAALVAAAERPQRVRAVVSRGGRPDLAGTALSRVQAPTLLIVGSADTEVLSLNQHALAPLHCTKRLEIIPGASHLFQEQGALGAVARLARAWFQHHLALTLRARMRL